MVSLLEGVRNGVRGVYCSLLASTDYINGGLGVVSPGLRQVATDIYLAQRRFAGCDPAGDVAPPDPPFTGGQCDCSLYEVTITAAYINNNDAPVTDSFTRRARGVVASATATFSPGAPNRILYTIVANNVGNLSTNNPPCNVGAAPTAFTFRPSSASVKTGTDVTTSAVNIQLLSGADDCGNPDPIYPPPTNINIDIDITYEGDDGTTINLSVPFVFAPITANFDGTLRIPFTFELGGINFNGDLNFDPSLPLTINFPRLPSGTGQGTETQPPDQPGESVESQPPERKIIGVVVTATAIQQGRVSSYDSPGIPEIYVPRLGSVKFVYNLGGATFFSSDIDVKDRRTFIECPFPGGADAVIASPQVGVDFSFLPIRGFPLATTGDLPRQG